MNRHGGERKGAGRPKNMTDLKKVAIGIRLPIWLLDKMKEKPENRPEQIEKALCKLNGWERPNA